MIQLTLIKDSLQQIQIANHSVISVLGYHVLDVAHQD